MMCLENLKKQNISYCLFNQDCHKGLKNIADNFIDAIVTDPPYGISYQNNYWDKELPNKEIWQECFRILKPGGFALIFSSVRLMHRLMIQLEDTGFLIKDVLFWVYLNGMPKSKNIGLNIDKELGIESEIIEEYKYVQGYKKVKQEHYSANKKYKKKTKSKLGKKYNGSGNGLKPAYEPIILLQKPMEKELNIAQNIIKYGVGALNIEQTRIPYENNEKKVGHNPHPKGRFPSNIIRTDYFLDEYDKFFVIPKVRQKKENFNYHPTLKPIELMEHLIKLVSFENQIVLDPFMGSGTTVLACLKNNRKFIGFEIDKGYYNIAQKRLNIKENIQ